MVVRIGGKASTAVALDAMRKAGTALLGGIILMDLSPPVVARALAPFSVPVRTLGALHLATFDYLRSQGSIIELASYDAQFVAAAMALGFQIAQV